MCVCVCVYVCVCVCVYICVCVCVNNNGYECETPTHCEKPPSIRPQPLQIFPSHCDCKNHHHSLSLKERCSSHSGCLSQRGPTVSTAERREYLAEHQLRIQCLTFSVATIFFPFVRMPIGDPVMLGRERMLWP